jgi:hypothetical protein
MRKSAQHVSGLIVVAVFTLGLIGTGRKPPTTVATPTTKTGTFTLKPKADDLFTKQTTAQMLQANAHPSIVLRVPAPGAKVTEEEIKYNVSIYNAIEKEFAKAGYVVRDRALFAKVLEQEVLDYTKIGAVTQTDLILELVSFSRPDYTAREYVDERGARATASRDIVFSGVQLEFKLVSVKENDMVGAYTFHYAPCATGCRQTWNADQTEPLKVPSEVPMDFFREAASRLIQEFNSGR